MRTLKVVWGILLLAGLQFITLGYVFENVLTIGKVPGFVALGAALILLAVTSMLNWVFKEAWETRLQSDSPMREEGVAQ